MSSFPPYDPVIEDPYPTPQPWLEVTDFEYLDNLYIARAKTAVRTGAGREAQYVVSAEYRCRCKVNGEPREIVVPSGMLTDLASVPRFARLLVGRVGPHLEAAIVHDFLFIAWQDLDDHPPRKSDFRFSNNVMLAAMVAAGVSWWRRNMIYLAVSTPFGRSAFFDANPRPRYVRVPSPQEPYKTNERAAVSPS